MDWTAKPASHNKQDMTTIELPQQTVAPRDLEIARWRPAESYGTSTSTTTDILREDLLNTSLEDSGIASPTLSSSEKDCSSASSSGDEDGSPEPDTPLEYARFHGLCRDFQADHPLSSELIPLSLDGVYHEDGELGDTSYLDALQAEVHDSLNEKLDIDKEAAKFLMAILRTCKQGERDLIKIDLATLGLATPGPRRLRLELPVLSVGDHEVDMMTLRRRHEVALTGKGIEPFQLDEDKGEGLKFSPAEVDDKQRLDGALQNEKLDVGKETVELFRQLRDCTAGKEIDYANEAYSSYKVGKALHISPPLLPVTPPYSPAGPAPEAMQIDLTSTPEDLIAQDLAAVEKDLLDHDHASNTTSAAKPPPDAQEIAAAIESYTAAPSSSSPLTRKRLRNLRVEAPLTPRYPAESTSEGGSSTKKAKKVHFDASLLQDFRTESSELTSDFARQQLDDLQDNVARGAESVEQQLQNEQLIEIDTTMRIKVPKLDAVQIQPPWVFHSGTNANETQLQSQQSMLHKIIKDPLKNVRKWSGVAKIERSLQWAPFASYLAKVDMVEQFDDGSLERYFADMNLADGAEDVDVHALIAKDDGMGLLASHDSDDEEVEPVITAEDDIVDPMLEEDPPTRELPTVVPPSGKSDILEVLRAKQRDLARTANTQPTGPGTNETFTSALTTGANTNLLQSDGIAQFMQLRGKSMGMQRSDANPVTDSNIITKPPVAQNQTPAAVMVAEAETPSGQVGSPVTIPIPNPPDEQHATIPIIVSSAAMASRQLIRRIQAVLPNIELYERDATVASGPQHGGNVHREADFTISASTGVMSTTLQKLKQKPLPGQMSVSGLRDVIASTAILYERLVVLVSEGNNMGMEEGAVVRTLDQLDCDALADLTTWAQSLDSDIQVSYVPGGEQELAGWLAATFSHLGAANGKTPLLQDETMWERWLRVAGMNAYAAQAVLVQLKLPDDDLHNAIAPSTQKRFGLAAFVSMTVEERVERFASTLGGQRVLRRISEAIEGGWSAKCDRLKS